MGIQCPPHSAKLLALDVLVVHVLHGQEQQQVHIDYLSSRAIHGNRNNILMLLCLLWSKQNIDQLKTLDQDTCSMYAISTIIHFQHTFAISYMCFRDMVPQLSCPGLLAPFSNPAAFLIKYEVGGVLISCSCTFLSDTALLLLSSATSSLVCGALFSGYGL